MQRALRDHDIYKTELLKQGEVKVELMEVDVREVASTNVGNTEGGREAEDQCPLWFL